MLLNFWLETNAIQNLKDKLLLKKDKTSQTQLEFHFQKPPLKKRLILMKCSWVLVNKFMNVYPKVKNNKTIIINSYHKKEKVIKEVVANLIELKFFILSIFN